MQYGPGNRKDTGKGCELSTAIFLFREDAGTSVTSDGGKKITAADVGGGGGKKEGPNFREICTECRRATTKFHRRNSERPQQISPQKQRAMTTNLPQTERLASEDNSRETKSTETK